MTILDPLQLGECKKKVPVSRFSLPKKASTKNTLSTLGCLVAGSYFLQFLKQSKVTSPFENDSQVTFDCFKSCKKIGTWNPFVSRLKNTSNYSPPDQHGTPNRPFLKEHNSKNCLFGVPC